MSSPYLSAIARTRESAFHDSINAILADDPVTAYRAWRSARLAWQYVYPSTPVSVLAYRVPSYADSLPTLAYQSNPTVSQGDRVVDCKSRHVYTVYAVVRAGILVMVGGVPSLVTQWERLPGSSARVPSMPHRDI